MEQRQYQPITAVPMISPFTFQKMNKKHQNCVMTKLVINATNSFENHVESAEFTKTVNPIKIYQLPKISLSSLFSRMIATQSPRSTFPRKKSCKFSTCKTKSSWFYNEIINSFLYVPSKYQPGFLYCDSIAALLIAEEKEFSQL